LFACPESGLFIRNKINSNPTNPTIIKKYRFITRVFQPFSNFVVLGKNLNKLCMKKSLRTISLSVMMALLLPLSNINAQTFDQGDIVLSAGFGVGANYYTGGWGYSTTFPPIFVAGDYCLREDLGPGNLGVGGYIGYSAYKYDYYGDWGWKYSTLIIAARGTYHFTDLVDKLDLYGGLTLGAELVTDKAYGDYPGTGYTTNTGGVAFEMLAGARYYFTDSFSAMGELGYGIAWLKLGVSLRL
jgi:hypothetical protein